MFHLLICCGIIVNYCLKNESFYIGSAYPEAFKELESLDSFSGIDHDVAENLEVFE